ncbi:amino acid permease [Endozoicomonas montiporae]|uniref:Serine transporter n=1 Tax=Endozoicomonas montiporae CL-33 TaxID=570277 RepID=A0A142BFH6_9GAMM|nr:aromatic amino acid transport family protein [Endozoicomonas montiporae]AMO57502.1 serine transporter [Endozoicomonas montiporae CL-33]
MPESSAEFDGRRAGDSGNPVSNWTARDTGWMLNLFGTAIGAGILYLPISAGVGGIWPLIILSMLAGPMVWLAHRNLVRFCLSGKDPAANITSTVRDHFGEKAGQVLTFAYFLSIYPIILLYGIGITNVVLSFIEHQLHMEIPSRLWLCLSLVVLLVAVMHAGETWMLRAVKLLCYPLVAVLLGISLYLVPQWNLSAFDQPVDFHGVCVTLFLTTPLLIFSFNHSPACSAFAQAYRVQIKDEEACARKTAQILKRNTQLLLVVILLFVFSSVLSLSAEDMAQAKTENLPILSILANRSGNPFFSIIAPCIAFLAIASSWFGVYLGTLEGIQGLVVQQWVKKWPDKPVHTTGLKRFSVIFVVLTCWIAGYANWSVIGMVEMVVVPVLATILYLMPVYGFYRVERLKHFRQPLLDGFTVLVGLIAITAFLLDKIF